MTEYPVEYEAEAVVHSGEKKPIRVLHVDDESSLLKITKQCLEMEGQFQVDMASSVDQAIEKMKDESYDAVVSDYQMSGKDGLSFLAELREKGNKIPFIVFTGKGREEIAIKALNLGADQYLNKTGDPQTVYSELAHAIRSTVERKQAEEALRESEEKLKAILFSSPDAITVFDLNGNVVELNQAAMALHHFSEKTEIVGRSSFDFVSPRDLHKAKETFKKTLRLGCVRNSEFNLLTREGYEFLVELSASVVPDAHGRPSCVVAVIKDIMERRDLDGEQKDSEQRLHILFECAPDAYYLNDLKGNFVDGNRAAEEITGYTRDELIGKSFLKLNLLSRDQILKAGKLLALNALGKPTGPDEFVLNRKDGVQIPVEIRTIPTKFKGKTLVLGIARDIRERKKAERLVLESQQKFAGLFRGNPEATVYTDPDMRILDVNPRFTNLFGYKSNEVKGRYLDDVVVPRSLKEEGQMLGKKTFKGYVYFDTVRVKKDGSLIPVSIAAAPIFMEGHLTGYIGVYKDISQLKKTENGLKQAMRKQEIMNEKLRVVGGLTRHDVRNKLAVIAGNVYLIEKELVGNDKILEYLGEIEDAVQQSVRIYDFAKAYEMLGVEELSYIDVEKTVGEAVSLFSDLRGAEFVNDCHGLTVLADSLLRQLFYNLIDNSLKHGQKVTKIRIHYERAENGGLRLVYADDGIGMRGDAKTKIFNEGYTTGRGSGYGLYLIKKMTEVYGWIIQERGEPGKGVEFVVEIPRQNSSGNENYRIA